MSDRLRFKRRRPRLAVAGTLLAAAALIAGCTSADTSADANDPVTIGYTAEDTSLDPNLSIVTSWQSVLSNLYDTVVRRDHTGEIVPSLATSWSQTDDLTWELELRDDVTFHDGSPFSADDVTFTLNRVLDDELASPQRTYISSIASVETVDPTTVRITTSEPFPLLIENLQLVPIVSSSFVDEGGDEALTTGANGTGPYSLVSWSPGSDLVLEAYEENWHGAPDVANATFRPIPEVGARVSALQAGEIDIAVGVQPESIELIDDADGLRIESVLSQRSNYIVLDNETPPFDDVRVRQAMNYAVDKQSIIDNLLLGQGEPLPSMVGPMYRGYNEDLDPYPYDPDMARSLLADAGYPDGFEVVFNSSDVRPKDREIASSITSQLREVGIQVQNDVTEWGQFLDRYSQHDLGPMYIISFGTPVWDFAVPFNSYLNPDSPQSYYRDQAIQDAVTQAASITEPDERQKAFAELNATLRDDAAFVYLFSYQDIYGVADHIEWTATSDEKLWLPDVTVQGS